MTIRVLVVDDSALVRRALTEVLSSDPEFEVIGTAAHPYEAVELMKRGIPDVITLDIEMPRMDGLTFLRKIMAQRPVPVVICSTLAEKGAAPTLDALEAGAVDIITKPKLGTEAFFREARVRVCDTIRGASQVRPRPPDPSRQARPVTPVRRVKYARLRTTEKIIVIGASTGGTEALRVVLSAMPVDAPAIAIVQHMPAGFTRAFADRLNASLELEISEAKPGEALLRGRALIAPGDKHLLIQRDGARYFADLREGPLVSRHRPSVDVLFRSAAHAAGENVVAAILTGMGRDGARGMKDLKEAGARTFAQDQASSVVYGMPGSAVELGGVEETVPLDAIAERLLTAAET